MHAFTKPTQKFLTKLFAGMCLPPEGRKKIDNTNGVFMPLVVERLTEDRYSMSHYYEQNGDLVPDPDMEIWRDENGIFYPVALQQNTGHYSRAIEFGADGKPSGFAPTVQRELVQFMTMWARNLRAQQGL